MDQYLNEPNSFIEFLVSQISKLEEELEECRAKIAILEAQENSSKK